MAKIKLKGGPLPMSGVKKAADKMIEDKKVGKVVAVGQETESMDGKVTEKTMLAKFIPKNVAAMAGPKGKSKMSNQELIAEGIFAMKDGDLVPTAKYQALKKSGGLSKYGIQ